MYLYVSHVLNSYLLQQKVLKMLLNGLWRGVLNSQPLQTLWGAAVPRNSFKQLHDH